MLSFVCTALLIIVSPMPIRISASRTGTLIGSYRANFSRSAVRTVKRTSITVRVFRIYAGKMRVYTRAIRVSHRLSASRPRYVLRLLSTTQRDVRRSTEPKNVRSEAISRGELRSSRSLFRRRKYAGKHDSQVGKKTIVDTHAIKNVVFYKGNFFLLPKMRKGRLLFTSKVFPVLFAVFLLFQASLSL